MAKFVSVKQETLILDFSGAYRAAAFPHRLRAEGVVPKVLDLRAAEGTSCYCDDDGARAIRTSLAPFSPEGIHWLDSGDYHYATCFFVEKIDRPYTLLLLDHHSDCQPPSFPGVLSCGSWVAELLCTDPRLTGVISVGPEAEPRWLGAPDPAGSLYVSLDKDILSREWARTNWDQGEWRLPDLLDTLAAYMDAAAEVIGIDVCGECPPGKGAQPGDEIVNENTNIEIQRFIKNYFKY